MARVWMLGSVMNDSGHRRWLEWGRELLALSQTGRHFATDAYDQERYARVGQIAAEIMAAHSNLEKEEIVRWSGQEWGYATPKVDVRGVVFRDGQILLVRENADEGRWTLPGGWADVNESPREAVEREVREESGLVTRASKVLAVYDRERQGHQPPFPCHIYKLFFLCVATGGELIAGSHETAAAAFFPRDHLPELSVSRVTAAQLRRCFEHHDHPEWPTDFD